MVLVPTLVLGFLIFSRLSAVAAEEQKQKSAAAARRATAPSVEVAVAEQRPIVDELEAVGSLVSEFSVSLSPRVAGQITAISVREGDTVRSGQVLVQLDPSLANAQVLQGQANVNESRSRLAQAEATLRASEVQIEQEIVRARAELSTAESNLAQVRESVAGRTAEAQATVRGNEAALTVATTAAENRRAELDAANATLRNAQVQLDRAKTLVAEGYVAKSRQDDAEAALEVAQANVAVRNGAVNAAAADVAAATAQLEASRVALTTTQRSGRAEIAAAEARVRQARSSVRQAEANRAQTPANQANLQALRAGVASVQAQLEAAETQRSDTELRSPIAGVITFRAGDPGTLASPGQPVLRVESLDELFLLVSVPVADAGRVRAGQAVLIRVDGIERPISARVEKTVPSADLTDRQVQVRIRLTNENRELRPGMFARVSIETGRTAPTVVVPSDAVRDGKVTVVDDTDTARMQTVQTGRSDKRGIQILNGLRPGDRVVVLSYSPVRDGAKVSVNAIRKADGSRELLAGPEVKR